MRAKSVFGVIAALAAVLYCGGLVYYFLDLSGSVEGAKAIGLGPTVLGLGVVGLLFFTLLVIRIVRISAGPRSPGSDGRGGKDAPTNEGEFDADAVIARYLARQPTEVAAGSPTHKASGPARQSGFGRRSR